MKKFLLTSVLLFTVAMSACQKSHDKKAQNDNKKPVPQTITQQEVARIAILEVKQLLGIAQDNKLDIASAEKIYQQAQNLYEQGAFKKAQIKAVEARHQLESLRK